MLLSELKTGEKGTIVKVYGHGAFRKRIIEMGFIKGKEIEVILNAPLKDPVDYRIMDYYVSLRREDAKKIEVVSEGEVQTLVDGQSEILHGIVSDREQFTQKIVNERSKEINVALVGNPNCGKTCIFNIASNAHERVGNYCGVTVDAKVGQFKFQGFTINLVDLPGTYSLSAYSPEELYVRKHIVEKTPDIILNVVDSMNLERNLYLTSQIIDMDVKVVMALNMYDELKKSGNELNYKQLGILLGIPIVPTVGRTGEGVKELFKKIIDVYEDKDVEARHIHVNHGQYIEQRIEKLRTLICTEHFNDLMSSRFLSIKLLENDSAMEDLVLSKEGGDKIIALRNELQDNYQSIFKQDMENAITDAKYGYVRGALKEVYNEKFDTADKLTRKIDLVITHKIWGYPIFLLFMYITFFITFNVGQYPMDWIDNGIGWLGGLLSRNMHEGPLRDLLVDGIIGGVGSVIVFLPNILILYLFISFMEDSGYMARGAFIMDKIMHKMGLHGKSFIPMLMGFGCNIPAIMATRTIEDRRSRLITMLIIPFMSCSARIPVYMILIGAFFPHNAAFMFFILYLSGIIMSIIVAKILSRFFVKGESTPFVMELPPYRWPSMKSVFRHTWEKGKQYLRKMGTVILLAAILIWFLGYYPNHNKYDNPEEQIENSYIGMIGKSIEPALKLCGFDWKQSVAILTGAAAKEIVVSTMGVLYSSTDNKPEEILEADIDNKETASRLSTLIYRNITPLSALSMMFFVLLYMPCLPGIIAIKSESGRWKWALFVVVYTIVIAWIVSVAIFQIGSLLL